MARKYYRRRNTKVGEAMFVALVLGALYLMAQTLVLVWSYLLLPFLKLTTSQIQKAKYVDRRKFERNGLESHLGKPSQFHHSTWAYRFAAGMNIFLITTAACTFFAKYRLGEAAIISFLTTALALIALAGVQYFFGPRSIRIFSYIFGRTVLIVLETSYAHSLEIYNVRHSQQVRPFMDEIEKYAIAHAKVDGDLPRPIDSPLNISEIEVSDFNGYLKKKGFDLPDRVLLGLLRDKAANFSANKFFDLMLARTPHLATSKNPKSWAVAYVDLFSHNKDYQTNLLVAARVISDSPVFVTQILSEIQWEIRARTEKTKHDRIQREMESGVAFARIKMEDIDTMDGHEFEDFLEGLLKDMGYEVTPTKQVSDQGADILIEKFGEKTVVQAKRYSQKVSNSAIQEVVAAKAHYKCSHAIVIANQEFTRSALELARSNAVELWDREVLATLFLRYPQYARKQQAA